jgi:DMSO/TMAO reductase YedYZ molybdopterin-dependent catalytic subunit
MSELVVEGAVAHPLVLTYQALSEFADSNQIRDVSRFPSRKQGDGVTLDSILDLAQPRAEANYLTLHATKDGFHASVPLAAVRAEGVVVYRLQNAPLPAAQGGPFRFLIRDPSACHTSELDDCANVKYIDRIELSVGKGPDNRPKDDDEHEALHRDQSNG